MKAEQQATPWRFQRDGIVVQQPSPVIFSPFAQGFRRCLANSCHSDTATGGYPTTEKRCRASLLLLLSLTQDVLSHRVPNTKAESCFVQAFLFLSCVYTNRQKESFSHVVASSRLQLEECMAIFSFTCFAIISLYSLNSPGNLVTLPSSQIQISSATDLMSLAS